MIKPILKALSFSFVTLVSVAILPAAPQDPAADRGSAPADSARAGCATGLGIDLGWDEQLAQLEKRLAEKEAEGLAVPGAIITPPFETFAPYRTDMPPAVNVGKAVKSTRRDPSGRTSRD